MLFILLDCTESRSMDNLLSYKKRIKRTLKGKISSPVKDIPLPI